MTLLDLMDALQVHAAAAGLTASATLTDVKVGFPAGKGRCVRIFYGGERDPERLGGNKVLNASMYGQAIVVRGYWPTASTGVSEQRAIEGQIAVFVKDFRSRVLGDSQLGGKSVDLAMLPAETDQISLAGTSYAIVNIEIVVDYDETAIAP